MEIVLIRKIGTVGTESGFIPAEHHTDLGGLAIGLVARVVLVVLDGHPVRRRPAVLDHLVVELDDLTELLGLHPVGDLAVLHVDALLGRTGVEVGGNASGIHHQERAPPITDLTGIHLARVEGDLIGLAIAVRILGLECLHDLAQVIPGLRHREAQLVKPGLVDHEMLAGGKEALGTTGWQHSHFSVDGDELLSGRLFLEELLDIRQLVQIVAKLLKS